MESPLVSQPLAASCEANHQECQWTRDMDTNDLYQLVYVSQSGDDVDALALEAIRRQAASNNLKLGITGVLLLGGGCFLQLLEGPREAIAMVYGKIAIDSRHKQPNVL